MLWSNGYCGFWVIYFNWAIKWYILLKERKGTIARTCCNYSVFACLRSSAFPSLNYIVVISECWNTSRCISCSVSALIGSTLKQDWMLTMVMVNISKPCQQSLTNFPATFTAAQIALGHPLQASGDNGNICMGPDMMQIHRLPKSVPKLWKIKLANWNLYLIYPRRNPQLYCKTMLACL